MIGKLRMHLEFTLAPGQCEHVAREWRLSTFEWCAERGYRFVREYEDDSGATTLVFKSVDPQ